MTPAEQTRPEQAERRTADRHPPDEAIGIELLADGRRLRGIVRDVSVKGMKLALGEFDSESWPEGWAAGCPVGSRVLIEHPVAGTFRGVCIWSQGRELGIELLEPTREIERVLQCICLLIGPPSSSQPR
ncbi:MAG: PilZ domain-containing protein [Tistlia sp.]|uniref:PilZ domain-containing protein n=1 Tax=Tistlia sp. TaxID=3057121 RepID=UPI0034A140A8